MPNFLDRNFEIEEPEAVFCTDITYLNYGNGRRAYLSLIQDLATKEIIHFKLNSNLTLGLATEGIRDLYFGIRSRGPQWGLKAITPTESRGYF